MVKSALGLSVFLICAFVSQAQEVGTMPIDQKAVSAMRKIRAAFCHSTVDQNIANLDKFSRDFPFSKMLYNSNRILADLYILQKKDGAAIKALTYVLHYKPDSNWSIVFDDTLCDNGLKFTRNYRKKAEICLSMSRAYANLKRPDSSLHYLTLAETRYMPYGCGNGMVTLKQGLTSLFVKQYLAKGGTLSAINRLLESSFMEYPYGGRTDEAATQLLDILKRKYTTREIRNELNNALNNLTLQEVASAFSRRIGELQFFDGKVLFTIRHGESLEKVLEEIKKSPLYKVLMEE